MKTRTSRATRETGAGGSRRRAKLPAMFRSLLWSYRFEEMDPEAHRDELIVNTMNYGDLRHWRWLIRYYGLGRIRRVLQRRAETEFTPESRNLARVVFSVKRFRRARGRAH